MALESAYVLFLAGDGQRNHQGDSGTRWTQDNYHVCPVQPPVP